jgi:hypothetical protein
MTSNPYYESEVDTPLEKLTMWFYSKKGKENFGSNDYWENRWHLPVSKQIQRCICLDNFWGKVEGGG